jgi:cell division protein FtsZ
MSIGDAIEKGLKAIETGIESLTQIKVIGLGGGGSNAVNNMIIQNIPGVDFIAVNTDAQALVKSIAPVRLRIGDKLTRGLGVGGDYKLGMMAAQESRDDIANAIQGADMLFITAGMGGGTGTGAAPLVAEVARELGTLTIAIVTMPFSFEGVQRTKVAEEGIAMLGEKVDTLVVIPNDRLLRMCDMNISIESAFKLVDDVLHQSVLGVYEVIVTIGHINLDFSDVKTIMREAGHAWIAIGRGGGATRAVDAARAAISNPIFDFSMERAKRILFNIIGNDLTLAEINDVANVIKQVADPEAQIIFGFGADPEIGRMVKVNLIATDFSEVRKKPRASNDVAVEVSVDDRSQPVFSRVKEGSLPVL